VVRNYLRAPCTLCLLNISYTDEKRLYLVDCVYVCVRAHTHTHTHARATFIVLCLQCSCTIKLVDKLHTLCLQLYIHYFHYYSKKHLSPYELCRWGSINSDAPIDVNINDQGTKHQRSQKKNDQLSSKLQLKTKY